MSASMTYFDNNPNDRNGDLSFDNSFSSSTNNNNHNTRTQHVVKTGLAFETAVASYASRVLKRKSPPESVIDSSVGPYIASMLRSALEPDNNNTSTIIGFYGNNNNIQIEALDEYESLMELLEEHCNMNEDVAKSALQSIAKALVTGNFDDDEHRFGSSVGNTNGFGSGSMGKYRSLSLGAENEYYGGGRYRSLSLGHHTDNNISMENSAFFGQMFPQKRSGSMSQIVDNIEEESFYVEGDEVIETSPRLLNHLNMSSLLESPVGEQKGNNEARVNSTFSATPLKLIPGDLLGVINDPSTPTPLSQLSIPSITEYKPSNLSSEQETTTTSDSKPSKESKPSNENKVVEHTDNSSNHDSSSSASDPAPTLTNEPRSATKKKKKNKKDLDITASLFSRPRSRSIHDTVEKSPKLKAMACAPAIPGGNLNSTFYNNQVDSTVQWLMAMNFDLCEEAAYEAVLVSNADVNVAQHVVDGAISAPPVCRHMLNDGCYRSDCQFSHDVDGHTCLFWLKGRCGKHDCKFMHGFSEKLLEGVDLEALSSNMSPTIYSAPIQTSNLVQHNMRAQFSLLPPATGNPANSSTSVTQTLEFSPGLNSSMSTSMREPSQSAPQSSFSFASIASKGYSKQSSFGSNNMGGQSNYIQNEIKTVRIPQNLWNAFYNRSSDAFHIADPLARYREVSASTMREDVIDLHFQSVKTFSIVLSSVLPEKLRDLDEVWIVTGTGHHVNANSHQKGGGVLESAVIDWLEENGYDFSKGKDKNGHGGACLVRGRNR